jgi:hypothetical protein
MYKLCVFNYVNYSESRVTEYRPSNLYLKVGLFTQISDLAWVGNNVPCGHNPL